MRETLSEKEEDVLQHLLKNVFEPVGTLSWEGESVFQIIHTQSPGKPRSSQACFRACVWGPLMDASILPIP